MSKQRIALLAAGGFVLFVFIKIFLDYRKAKALGISTKGQVGPLPGNWYVQIFGMPSGPGNPGTPGIAPDYSAGIWLNPNDYFGPVEEGQTGKTVTVTTQ